MNDPKLWAVFHRESAWGLWLPVLECDDEAEARHWLARVCQTGGYRVGRTDQRPDPSQRAERTVEPKARPKKCKVPVTPTTNPEPTS